MDFHKQIIFEQFVETVFDIPCIIPLLFTLLGPWHWNALLQNSKSPTFSRWFILETSSLVLLDYLSAACFLFVVSICWWRIPQIVKTVNLVGWKHVAIFELTLLAVVDIPFFYVFYPLTLHRIIYVSREIMNQVFKSRIENIPFLKQKKKQSPEGQNSNTIFHFQQCDRNFDGSASSATCFALRSCILEISSSQKKPF